MKERLLQWLACPDCHGTLDLTSTEKSGDEIMTGSLTCTNCHKIFQILRGVPRFVHSDEYVHTFSFEWNLHQTTQLDSKTTRDDSAVTFKEKTGFIRQDIDGKRVLEVGCGSGRFLEVARNLGGEVIGIDLSFAVDAAYRNLGRDPKVHVIQADVFRLPFKERIFDVIYSIGVLHHTPDTKKAFLSTLPFLKTPGKIAIWVYDFYSHQPFILTRFYRKLTTRIPKRLLHALSYIAVPYYYLLRIPVLRYLFKVLLFTPEWKDWRWRVLDMYDWYSPKYQWWHTDHEVFEWFESAGLKNIRVLDLPVAISGEKAS